MRKLWLIVVIMLILTACGATSQPTVETTSDSAPSSASQSRGEALLLENGCIACHATEEGPNATDIGPVWKGLMERSAQIIESDSYTGEATTVEEYIRESILKPEVYVVDGYLQIMPNTYQHSISEDDLNEIINYLQTLDQ